MADNVAITAGSGTTISADDVGAGVLQQRVKVTWGPDGTGNDTDVASGKPLPVQHRVSDGTAWTYGSGASGTGSPRVIVATDSAGMYTEDAAAAADPVGHMIMGVRRDTLSTSEVSTDGDNVAVKATSKGQLHVRADIGDGTNAPAIKAASTAPGATDPALVVSISPNSVNANGQTTASASAPVTLPSDRQNSIVFSLAMTTDTSAYASGDLIADTQQLDAFFNKTDGKGVINSITIVEKDAQGAAYYILFHKTSTSMGTENSAPNISDANAVAGIQGMVAVATTDFVTVSGTKVACIKGIGLPVSAVSGTDDLYVSILNSTGTPTYASGEIQLLIGGLLD